MVCARGNRGLSPISLDRYIRSAGADTPQAPDVSPEDSRANPYNHFQRPDGYVLGYQSAPRWANGRPSKWPLDMPGVYFYPDTPGRTSNQPVVAAPGIRRPAGVKWVVFGGTNELLSDWMGVDAEKTIPVRFNGQAVGMWECASPWPTVGM